MNNKLVNFSLIGLIAIMAIVPFAIPYAYFPLSKFYSESVSILAGVLLFAVAIWTRPRLHFSAISLAAFAFALFALIQPLFVHIYFIGNNYYLALLFAIMGLISLAVSSFIADEEQALAKFLMIFCWSFVISATIQALIAYLQYTGKASLYADYILVSPENVSDGSNIFGNIGQPNQFTDFMSIGVVALCYLFFIGQINLVVFIAYSLLFAAAITFTARRGVLLYYVIMLFIIGYVWLRNRQSGELGAKYKKILLVIAAYFIGLILVQVILPQIVALFSKQPENVITGISRLSENSINQSTYRRFYEWYKALVLFVQHPLFGVGWYQYPREGIYIMLTERFMYIPQNMKLYTHSHNSLCNMLAETGIIGSFIIIGYGICYSIGRVLRKINNPQSLFVVLLMVPILIHSLLEYPLWYAYFLVILVVLLALAPSVYSIANRMLFKIAGSIVVICLLAFAYNANQVNNQLMDYTQIPTDYDDYVTNVTGLEQIVDSHSIWSLPAMMVLDNYIMPGSQATNAVMTLEQQEQYIDLLASVMPYPGSLMKQVIIHKMLGDNKMANYYANVLVHAYPYYQEQFIKQFSASPEFADVVQTMQAFHYHDASTLSKIFSRGN